MAKIANTLRPETLEKLASVLDRKSSIPALEKLIIAINQSQDKAQNASQAEANNTVDLDTTAIGIDTNVLLLTANHNKSADIVDYLTNVHKAPFILPGQSIQEFWNNELSAVDTHGRKLSSAIGQFTSVLDAFDQDFGGIQENLRTQFDSFNQKYGHAYLPKNKERSITFFEMLSQKAITPYAPRTPFNEICRQRKHTKTPPGFQDNGDGDFYIWLDYLTGLMLSKQNGVAFTHCILVTNDVKKDWSRNGVAHPILTAELEALVNCTFETWTLDTFVSHVKKRLQ